MTPQELADLEKWRNPGSIRVDHTIFQQVNEWEPEPEPETSIDDVSLAPATQEFHQTVQENERAHQQALQAQ